MQSLQMGRLEHDKNLLKVRYLGIDATKFIVRDALTAVGKTGSRHGSNETREQRNRFWNKVFQQPTP